LSSLSLRLFLSLVTCEEEEETLAIVPLLTSKDANVVVVVVVVFVGAKAQRALLPRRRRAFVSLLLRCVLFLAVVAQQHGAHRTAERVDDSIVVFVARACYLVFFSTPKDERTRDDFERVKSSTREEKCEE